MSSKIEYWRLSHDGNEEKPRPGWSPLRESASRVLWILFTSSVLLTTLSVGILISSFTTKPTDKQCAKQLSPYSPALDAIDYEWRTYENEFAKESIYRGAPTTEGEAAWETLWQFGLVSIEAGQIQSLNKSSSDNWRHLSDGGVGGFLEVFHQIHCLNLIRQYTYKDSHDYSSHPSFQGPAYLLRTHVDHCIETIRLNLMCVSDVTPVMVKLDPTSPNGESPDFNTLHKCRRFDKLQDWMREHVVANKLEHVGHES